MGQKVYLHEVQWVKLGEGGTPTYFYNINVDEFWGGWPVFWGIFVTFWKFLRILGIFDVSENIPISLIFSSSM